MSSSEPVERKPAPVEVAEEQAAKVDTEEIQNEMVQRSQNAGIPAFKFDPDASPEEKRREARAAIPDDLKRKHKVAAVATDVDDGSGPDEVLPEPTAAGVMAAPKDESGKPVARAGGGEEFPPYSRTGWAPMFGPLGGKEVIQGSLLDHQTWLEGRLPDNLYGDWYHNTGIMIFACVTSWLVAVFGGGLGWVLIILAICGTYYRTSLRRVRRNFRDDIVREMGLKRLENDNESLEWINSFLVKFWPIYQPVLAETVVKSVDQVLSSATPSFLDSLKLTTFVLGTKPPRMEHVKTYPKADDDIVIMDWRFSFTPNDTADMTSRQLKTKINPKIVLEIRVGKAMISKGLDVIVEDMAFSGLIRLKVKLQTAFPHVDRVEMSFLERPTIDYVCKPLGGEHLGFDINFIPGLESFILEQIHGNLAPMMYAPNVFPIEVAKMLAGTPMDQAIGVLAVTLHGANGLKNTDNFGGTVDPYAVLTLNQRSELAKTKTIEDNPNPRWNETHYVIITSTKDSLDIQVFDKNEFRKSKKLGVASFPLDNIEELYVHENERLDVVSDGKTHGSVSCDINFFPVLAPTKDEEGQEQPPPESNQGIVRFTVQQARELDSSKSMIGQLNPYATMFLNGKEINQTKKLKRTNDPIWDNGSKEILITDRKKAKLGISIKDDRDLAGDQTIGKYQIKLDEILACTEQGKEWYQLSGASSGRVQMTAKWKPVAISGVVGTGGYSTPIGVMRFHFKRANDLRNFESFGKSDPYTRVLLSGIEKARTVTFRNDLNPAWDEVLYVPIHSARDKLTLEVMDTEKMGKDRSLGLVELFAGDFVKEEDGEFLTHEEKVERQEGLRLHGKGMAKGTITYTCAFYPCLNIADPEDEEEHANGDATDPRASTDATSLGSKDRSSVDRSSDAGKFKASFDKASKERDDLPPLSPITPTTVGRPSAASQRPKLRLSPEELLKYESGLLIFHLMDSEMPESNSQLEIFVDDYLFPAYTSATARQRSYKFDEIGDCVIRELDFSRLTIKVRKKGDDEDDTLASLTGNTVDTLKQCLNNPTTLKLKADDGRSGWVKVSLKYVPIKMQLDASESINNMGRLRVDVIDAQELPSADRNGKSDPYCKFELNGQEVYKTKIIKKTLSPTWNENFEVEVPSRTAADMIVNVYDYDFADKPDFLGSASINLESLDPFKATESRLLLDGKSGSVRIRLLFRPDYIRRVRQGTSTFAGTFASTPGRIATGVVGAPIKGGTAVAGIVGSGVGRGATFLRKGIFGRKDSAIREEPDEVPTITADDDANPAQLQNGVPQAELPNERPPTSNGVTNHGRTKSFGASSVRSSMVPSAGSGTAVFTVVSAANYPSTANLYVAITQISPKEKNVGKTKHFKSPSGQWTFDESFKFVCAPDAQFKIEVKGEHLFGSDDDLGEHIYFVDESGSGTPKELTVGSGTVMLKSTFQPADAPNHAADSPKSPLRRSLLSKRDAGRTSREVTPNP